MDIGADCDFPWCGVGWEVDPETGCLRYFESKTWADGRREIWYPRLRKFSGVTGQGEV